MRTDLPPGVGALRVGVAAAGTTQDTATQIDALTTVVTDVPPGTGVRLNPMIGETQTIINAGANPLAVYPLDGMTIGGLAQNTPATIQPDDPAAYVVVSPTQAFAAFRPAAPTVAAAPLVCPLAHMVSQSTK